MSIMKIFNYCMNKRSMLIGMMRGMTRRGEALNSWSTGSSAMTEKGDGLWNTWWWRWCCQNLTQTHNIDTFLWYFYICGSMNIFFAEFAASTNWNVDNISVNISILLAHSIPRISYHIKGKTWQTIFLFFLVEAQNIMSLFLVVMKYQLLLDIRVSKKMIGKLHKVTDNPSNDKWQDMVWNRIASPATKCL